MKNCSLLSQKDNERTRKSYQTPLCCVTRLNVADCIRTSNERADETGYAWGGNNWSEVLGSLFN